MGMRLHEASKKYNLTNKETAQVLDSLGYKVKANALSGVNDEMLAALEAHFKKSGKSAEKKSAANKKQTSTKDSGKKPTSRKQTKATPKKEVAGKKSAPKKEAVADAPKAKKAEKTSKTSAKEEPKAKDQITIIKTTPGKKEVIRPKKKKAKDKKKKKKGRFEQDSSDNKKDFSGNRNFGKDSGVDQKQEGEQLTKITIPEIVTVSELAKYLKIEAVEIIKLLFGLGIIASLNQRLEADHIQLVGQEFGKDISFAEDVIEFEEKDDRSEDLQTRTPVVTIMGHVDHGKTSLLDYIRKARVADGEAGGITQHIGAYQVKLPNGTITFIDTPGHEAFTAMRAQGALVTDIAVLVVAADDGVQPQTTEAIHHAQAAGVPIIVAINKIDKPEAQIDRAKQQLTKHNLVADDWGGDITMVPVSAKTGEGINDLLEMIILQAEMLELKANPNRPADGIIIEAKLDRGMGPVATVLIRNGSIKHGDHIICGSSFGRVKALINDMGKRIKMAGPAFPVAILGLNDVPAVGDKLRVVESAKFARYVGELRQKKARTERLAREKRMKLVDLFKQVTEGQAKDLNIIIKADVQGSAGALKDSLERLSTSEVKVNVLHIGVGGITEADVSLASASNAIIIGFHVRTMNGVDDIAAKEGVEIKIFKIIYDAIDTIKKAIEGLYEPEYEEEVLGRAEVRKVYKITGVGAICGSYVLSGIVNRKASVRVIRDGIDVYEGKVSSLKRFKDDVKEVNAGYECGIGVENFNDIKGGDILELFQMKEVERVAENS